MEKEWQEIQKRAHLQPYKPPPFRPATSQEQRPAKREYLSVGKTDIGPYSIQIRQSKESCHIRVIENLEEGRSHTVGVWTGSLMACEPKRREVAQVIRQVRARIPAPERPTIKEEALRKGKTEPELKKKVDIPDIPIGKPGQYIVTSNRGPLTKKSVPLQIARDLAKAISAFQYDDIRVVDLSGQVEETYKRGARTYARIEYPTPPTGRQFYTPSPERSRRELQEELLEASKKGDTKAMLRIVTELAGA